MLYLYPIPEYILLCVLYNCGCFAEVAPHVHDLHLACFLVWYIEDSCVCGWSNTALRAVTDECQPT